MAWNLLTNAGFELGDPPTDWTLAGAGATFSRSSTQAKTGDYSGALTRNGANASISESLASASSYQSKTISFSMWVYATVASRARLLIFTSGGGNTNTFSSYHSGTPGWELLTVSKLIGASVTDIQCAGLVDTGDTTAYFDEGIVIQGNFPTVLTRLCEIAWTNAPFDASPTWVDVSADLKSFFIHRGRQHEVDVFEAGSASITLLNHAGDYWPDNGTSIYSPNVLIGKRVRISEFFNGILYSRYVGYIESYNPEWGLTGLKDPRMRLECGDALSLIARYYLNTSYNSELSGTRVTNVLNSASFITADRAIDTGQFTLQASTLTNTGAFDHLKTVSQSEIGIFYIDQSGIARFEDRIHRTLAPHTVSQATFATNFVGVKLSLDDNLLFNQVRATSVGGTEQVVNDSDSQTTYQLHTLIKTGLLLDTDANTQLSALYLLARFSNPYTRAVSLTILPNAAPSTLFPYCLGFDFSTRITVTAPSPSGINVDFFIENIEESFDAEHPETTQFRWLLSRVATNVSALQATLRPTGAGDLSGTVIDGTSPASTRWQSVNEVTADEDVTYVRSTDPPVNPGGQGLATDLYNIADPPAKAIPTKVTIYVRARYNGTAVGQYAVIKLKTGGSTYSSGNQNLTGSYANYSWVQTANPLTGLSWTRADITALQVGVSLLTPAWNETWTTRCTQVWVVLDYIG